MYTVNALAVRQHFGQVLQTLNELQQPVMIEKSHQPVAVMIPIELFKQRFIDLQEAEEKRKLLEDFKAIGVKANKDSLMELRELRYA
jgi:PHD/YefM family antitoxin component YafN of YafNO toxin-antitoxin module